MNYKKLSDWNSGFVNWVIRRHPSSPHKQNGFMGGFIFGERGLGKSTYCYKVLAKVYYELNGFNKKDDEIEAYKMALDCMLYEPSEFQRLTFYNKIKRIITPIICLDDASMHFGKMLHVTNPKLYAALLGQTATVRTTVTGFLINAPRRSHVAKFLRDYDDFKGEVKTDMGGNTIDMQGWNRKIRYYKWNYYPDEVKYRIQIPFQDKYSMFVPDIHYIPYVEKKRYYELKHDIEVADKVCPENQDVFIQYKEELPMDLKRIVDKWDKKQE